MKYLLSLIFLMSISSIFAQEVIVFEIEDELLEVGSQVSFLKDTEGRLSIQEILSEDVQQQFQQNNSNIFHKPISTSAYWMKLTVSNHSDQDLWLDLDKSFILDVVFYQPDSLGNYTKVTHTGALQPFHSRPYPIINGFWLPLNKAKEQSNQTYYVRVISHFGIDLALKVASLDKLYAQKNILDILSAAFIGLMLIMILYNSFLFITTKDNIYLLYTSYLFFITLTATFLNSFPIIEYFTAYQLQFFIHHYFSIWAYPTLILSGLFCIQYLDLKRNLPQAIAIIKWVLLSQIIIIILNLSGWVSMESITILEQIVPLALYTTCLTIAFYLFFVKNLKQARFYLLGWSFFFVGVILLVLSGNSLIPFNIYVRNASYFGIGMEIWMFSLALGDRLNFLQKEKQIAQVDRLTLIEEQKDLLEEKINKRTLQIKEQNLKLQENQEVLYRNKKQLQKSLEENQTYIAQIEEQQKQDKLKTKKLETNQLILQKSRDKLKKTLDENKIYVEQIQQQKEELKTNNDELIAKEEEIRQNFEELQSTQETLEHRQKQLKVALAENQSITQALNKSAIISITDLKGNILHVNNIFCQVAGYTEEELIGKNQNIVNSGYHPQELWKEMWKTIGTGQTWRGEIKNQAKNGTPYWVDAVINPMYNDQGKIYNYLSIRYLITEKKEVEERIQSQNREMTRKNKKIAKTIQTISNLSQNKQLLTGGWQVVSQEAIKAGVEALEIDTCELWYYNFKQVQMYCIAYESNSAPTSPQTVTPQESPLFFKILQNQHLLMVRDIETDISLSDEEKVYFINRGYQAFMLYPIILSKNQTGLLVCYQKEKYNWENEDIIFLKSVNDEFAFAYQAHKKEQAKEKIQEKNAEITKINKNLNDSITYAQRIQNAILPTLDEIQQHLPNSFIFFRPRDIVSGDFYFFSQQGNISVIAAVDCTGHGIPGAFMSLIGNDLLDDIVNVKNITQPDEILRRLRNGVIKTLKQKETNNQDGMDIAICTIYHATNHSETPYLEYAGAGNPLIYFQDGELIRIKPDKTIIGGFNNYLKGKDFTLYRIPLDKPTTFYIYSDGLQDQFGGPQNRKFTTRRLRELLQEIHQKDIKEQEQILAETITSWQTHSNQVQIDDMLLLGVKV